MCYTNNLLVRTYVMQLLQNAEFADGRFHSIWLSGEVQWRQYFSAAKKTQPLYHFTRLLLFCSELINLYLLNCVFKVITEILK